MTIFWQIAIVVFCVIVSSRGCHRFSWGKKIFTTVLWKNESEIIITPQQQQQQQEKIKRREEKRSKSVAYFYLLPLLEFYRRRCLCSSFLPWLVDSKVRISAATFVNFSWMQNFLFTPLSSAECDSLWSSNVFFSLCDVCSMYVCMCFCNVFELKGSLVLMWRSCLYVCYSNPLYLWYTMYVCMHVLL